VDGIIISLTDADTIIWADRQLTSVRSQSEQFEARLARLQKKNDQEHENYKKLKTRINELEDELQMEKK